METETEDQWKKNYLKQLKHSSFVRLWLKQVKYLCVCVCVCVCMLVVYVYPEKE